MIFARCSSLDGCQVFAQRFKPRFSFPSCFLRTVRRSKVAFEDFLFLERRNLKFWLSMINLMFNENFLLSRMEESKIILEILVVVFFFEIGRNEGKKNILIFHDRI